jgi:hypothetical protein
MLGKIIYPPLHLLAFYEAFNTENDESIENAPMKKKAPKTLRLIDGN